MDLKRKNYNNTIEEMRGKQQYRILDANAYMECILSSLGYDDVSKEIKSEFELFIKQWIEEITKTITINDTEIILYNVISSVILKLINSIYTSFIQFIGKFSLAIVFLRNVHRMRSYHQRLKQKVYYVIDISCR